jgi:hypothetical protein
LPNAELLSVVVRELKEIDRRSGIERTLAIGELIITRFFGGNPAAWRDRRRNKNNSVRRLAERKDCPFCKSALHEAVAVYVASLGLPCVRTFGHIGPSHVAAVLRLPEAQREQVLSRAEQTRLSVRELRKQVVSLRRAEGERRGRPARSSVSSGFALVESGLAEVREGVERVRASLPLQASDIERLTPLVNQLQVASCDLAALAAPGPSIASGPRLSQQGVRFGA